MDYDDVMHAGRRRSKRRGKKRGKSAKQCRKKCKRGGFLSARGRKAKPGRCCRKGMTK